MQFLHYGECLFDMSAWFWLVVRSRLVSSPLHEVFAADLGVTLPDEQIRGVARDITKKWLEVADRLHLPEDVVDEVHDRGAPENKPGRMLKKFRELMPESAQVCVLCDALHEVELKWVADKHFKP